MYIVFDHYKPNTIIYRLPHLFAWLVVKMIKRRGRWIGHDYDYISEKEW